MSSPRRRERVRRSARGILGAVLGLAVPGAGAGSALDAQTPGVLAAACTVAGGAGASCMAAALGSRSAIGQVGLLAGLGSEVAGTATTLGTRIGGGPRLSLSVRGAAIDGDLPDLSDPGGAAVASGRPSALHVGVAAGLFEGTRLMPTVGGFLSLDAFAQVALLRLPASLGFGEGARSYTGGLRVGIFREGFTVPGVSVSAAYRRVDRIEGGTTADPGSFAIDPRVTSLRATVGKDLYAVEVLAGVGWDRYQGDVTLRSLNGAGGFVTTAGTLRESRRLYYASASMTFSILFSVSVEGGMAQGFAREPAYVGTLEPDASTPFGGVSLRLVL